MAKRGKMQKVVMRVLAAMLLVSFVLAMASFVMPTNARAMPPRPGGGVTPLGVPYPVERCSLGCCNICQGGGCCPNGYPCYPQYLYRWGCIERCDEYWGGCLSGWYCTPTLCNAGCCN